MSASIARQHTDTPELQLLAVTQFYALLDSGTARSSSGYPGLVALNTVAHQFDVSTDTLWRWIRGNLALSDRSDDLA